MSTAAEILMKMDSAIDMKRRYVAFMATIKPYQDELAKRLACVRPRTTAIYEDGKVARLETKWDDETQKLIDAHYAAMRSIAKVMGLPVPPSATEEDAPT